MAKSFVRSTASGSTDTYSVPFGYLDKSHVLVSLNGVLQTPGVDYTWPTEGTIQFTSGNVSAGVLVEIRRQTPTELLVNFEPGNLSSADLNTGNLQPLYLAQEAQDNADDIDTRAWFTENYGAGGTITKGPQGQVASFDANGNLVPLEIVEPVGENLPGIASTFLRRNAGNTAFEALSAHDLGAALLVPVMPEAFGALANGVDDKVAIEAAAAAASSEKRTLLLSKGKTYTFSKLTIPAGTAIVAKGAVLRSDGSLTGSDVTLAIGNDVAFDEIHLSTPGSETNTDIVSLGDRVRGEALVIKADAQRAGGGITTRGQDVFVGVIDTDQIDRPLHFDNTGGGSATTGSYIGFLKARSYVRGFRATFCYDYVIGGYDFRVRSPNASVSPGHNGFLMVGSSNWRIGDGIVADAGEHAFRVGGSDEGGITRNGTMGVMTAIRPGGCAFKLNPTFETSPGVLEKCHEITVAGIIGQDVGDGVTSGNKELLRITRARDITIGFAHAIKRSEAFSGQSALIMNDVDGLHIGSLGGDLNSGMVQFDETSDNPGAGGSGQVINVKIDRLWGTSGGNQPIAFIGMPSHNIGNVVIDGIDLSGFTVQLARFAIGQPISGPIAMRGRVRGAVEPNIQDAPDTDNIYVDIEWAGARFTGRGSRVSVNKGPSLSVTSGATDLADTPETPGFLVNSSQVAGGLGVYGGGYFGTPPDTTRRGFGVIAKQTNANNNQCGIAFLCRSVGVSGTDALTERGVLDHQGNLSIDGAISKGSGTFLIDHPLDPENRDLIHGFIEGPRYDLLYRGRVQLQDGRAVIDIDAASRMTEGTFAALTQNAEVTSLCNQTGFARVRPGPVESGRFTILCEDGSSDDVVTWVVMAERADAFITEHDPWTDKTGRLVPEHDKAEAPITVDGAVTPKGVKGYPRHVT